VRKIVSSSNSSLISFQVSTFFKVVSEHRLTSNPDLVGLTSLELFDKTVEVLTKSAGLMVILNNHVTKSN
jgi:hypothetical protein